MLRRQTATENEYFAKLRDNNRKSQIFLFWGLNERKREKEREKKERREKREREERERENLE